MFNALILAGTKKKGPLEIAVDIYFAPQINYKYQSYPLIMTPFNKY